MPGENKQEYEAIVPEGEELLQETPVEPDTLAIQKPRFVKDVGKCKYYFSCINQRSNFPYAGNPSATCCDQLRSKNGYCGISL